MLIDHVICAVRDLDAAARRIERDHGLRFMRGGRHPEGTINSVAPLEPPQYLELLALDDPNDPAAREIEAVLASGRTFLGWGILVDDIAAVAARLGREVEAGSVTAASGSTSSWRGLQDSDDPALPFFIEYDDDPALRLRRWQERKRAVGNDGFGGFTFVEVGGDASAMRHWLGNADIPVRVTSGRPGLHAVGIAGPTREFVLRDES